VRQPEEAAPAARRGSRPHREERAGLTRLLRTPAVAIPAALGIAVVVAVLLWLVFRGGASSDAERAPAAAASIRRLNAFASSVQHPIYWAGAQPGYTYELSSTKDGRVYIRYLPPGVKPGSPKANYLTIGTYPQRHAFATLRATAKRQGAQTVNLVGGGRAFQYKSQPTSVYIAYPGSDYQIEVFDPSPARALKVATSGQIKPVGAPPRTPAGAKAVSLRELKELAVRLRHPVYWAGPEAEYTYELTQTRDGSVYIRYLPRGVPVGKRRPDYLTIGTYPQRDALQILKTTAARNRTPTISLGTRGLAYVDPQHSTSVFLAYQGVDLQIEVYDPSPTRARRLVTSDQIRPVGRSGG
jgi:hypothetical protein